MSAFRPVNSDPVRYSSSGPDRTSTPIAADEPVIAEADVDKAVNSEVGESDAGKTVNPSSSDGDSGKKITVSTGDSGVGKTVNTSDNLLDRVKGCNGPPFNPFKWILVNKPPPFKLEPAKFYPNPKLLGHVDRKKFMDGGDFNMFRHTNMREGINF